MAPGALYIVSTPIGNLEDITLRALRVLKEVDVIAAEDTRVAKKLLGRYGVGTPVESYHDHNEREKAPELIGRLLAGKSVALVSDAGTPGLSDPGYRLVGLAAASKVRVVPVPGPSSLLSALSVSGLPVDRFTFLGFVPHAEAARKKFFLAMREPDHTYVVFESASRLASTLLAALEALGDVRCVVARELTKVHEEVVRATLSSAIESFGDGAVKGEVTLVIRTAEAPASGRDLASEIRRLFKAGLGIREVSKALAPEFGMASSDVYREALRIRREEDGGFCGGEGS